MEGKSINGLQDRYGIFIIKRSKRSQKVVFKGKMIVLQYTGTKLEEK